MRRPAKSPLRRANIQLYWSAGDIVLCIWRGGPSYSADTASRLAHFGVLYLIFFFCLHVHVLSTQLNRLYCVNCAAFPEPMSADDLAIHLFFMKSWLMQKPKKKKKSLWEEDVCCPLWVGYRWWKSSQPTSQGERRCLPSPIVSDWCIFFPPFLYQPSSHYAHPTNLPFCQVSPIYSLYCMYLRWTKCQMHYISQRLQHIK